MQRIVWRQINLEIPDEWELLQFSRDPQFGTCAFADRYQFRLEMDWRRIDGRPDFDRMISDYRARLEEKGMTDVRNRQHAGWRGVQGARDGLLTSRFGNHLPELDLLVELVFLWPGDRDSALEQHVLATTTPEPEANDHLVHWRAFGMDMHTGRSLSLEKCIAEPGRQEFLFRNRRKFLEQRFTRLGMVGEWLHQPVADWLRTRVPKEYTILGKHSDALGGHTVTWLRGERRRSSVREMIRGPREFLAAAWVCPTSGRLYSFHHIGIPGSADRAKGAPKPRLGCCPGTEVHA